MNDVSSSEEYLQQISTAMVDRYVGDCLEHAQKIRNQLISEGRQPWIGRLRRTRKHGETTFHGPLIPLRFRGRAGPTWTTHYVCCCDGKAFDPLLAVSVPLAHYSAAVFGEEIDMERVPGL